MDHNFRGMRSKIEIHLQHECVLWFNMEFPQHIIIPVVNEGAYNNRNLTVLKGVSDTIIVMGRDVIFVEYKTFTGVQSQHQKVFEKRINNNGLDYFIIRSFEQFKELIHGRLRINKE